MIRKHRHYHYAVFHSVVFVALTLAFPAFADHGEPHEPDVIVIGIRSPCPDGHICLSGQAARDFARQLAELVAQELLRQFLEGQPKDAPEDEPTEPELVLDCGAILAEFQSLFDTCMSDADIAWGNCKVERFEEGLLPMLLEIALQECDDAKKNDEQTCKDDDSRRRGLIAPVCPDDGGAST